MSSAIDPACFDSGTAPDRIVAANHNTSSPFPSGGLFDFRIAQNFPANGTRPLCPYPQIPRYKGAGMTNDAANFACVGDLNRFKFDDHDADDDDDGLDHGRDHR